MIRSAKTLLLAFGLIGCSLATAANMGFMADQAMSRFTNQDAELFNAAAAQALAAKDGTKIEWKNPDSGAFGILTPYADTEGKPNCRIIHMENVAENVKSAGYYRFCRQPDGSWPPVMPPRK